MGAPRARGFFGARNPASTEIKGLLHRCGPGARAAFVDDAVREGEVMVVAVPWPATKPVLVALNLADKIVLNCTNPLKADLSGLELGTTTSGGEMVAQWAKGAKVVKIFNTTGYGNMANPVYGGEHISMFYCGDDAEAKRTAEAMARTCGFEPIDAGPLANARSLGALRVVRDLASDQRRPRPRLRLKTSPPINSVATGFSL